MPEYPHNIQRGNSRRRIRKNAPNQDTASISMPTPTMTRNVQNTVATGGCLSPNSERPFNSPSALCVRIRLAPLGSEMA